MPQMNLRVLKVSQKPSQRGGTFFYVFLKDEVNGKSYKTCIGSEFRNYVNWNGIRVGDLLTGVFVLHGNIVDADSSFRFAERGTEEVAIW